MSSVIQYSGNNTYVPSFEASGAMVTEFSRNPSKFKINRYVAQRKVEAMTGYYNVIDPDESARVVNEQDFIWSDGNDRPVGNQNTSQHQFNLYSCKRYNDTATLGFLSVQQASWDILAQHSRSLAAKAMSLRTMLALDTLTNASWGSNTGSATSLGGGFWSAGSSTAPYIMKTLFAAAQTIQQATNSAVALTDMILLIGPGLAAAMAESAEVHDYVILGTAGIGTISPGLPCL